MGDYFDDATYVYKSLIIFVLSAVVRKVWEGLENKQYDNSGKPKAKFMLLQKVSELKDDFSKLRSLRDYLCHEPFNYNRIYKLCLNLDIVGNLRICLDILGIEYDLDYIRELDVAFRKYYVDRGSI